MIKKSYRHADNPLDCIHDNFTIGEFWCKCGKCDEQLIEDFLVYQLEALRTELGDFPIHITSGYRCPAHNKAVGGAPRSQHLTGNGADIVVSRLSPGLVGKKAVKVGFSGVKVYESWVHVDVRKGKSWHVNV